MNDTKRDIIWIDWLKFICIVLVFWDHTILYGNNSAPFIIPFRYFFVNAFFFVSGYLIFMKEMSEEKIKIDRKSFLKNQICKSGMLSNILFRIAIPTILFAIPLFFPACIVKGEDITLKLFIFDNFVKGGNWFTCALTISEIFIFVLLMTRIRSILFYTVSCFCISMCGVYLLDGQFLLWGSEYAPWFYKSGMIACAFLAMGGVYQKFEERICKYGLLYLTLFILISINCDQDTIKMSTWAGINFEGFAISLLSILAVISLCQSLKQHSFVKYISRRTIGLYFLSGAVPFFCARFGEILLPKGGISFISQFIFSFGISLSIVYLLERYMPFLFDLRILIRNKK